MSKAEEKYMDARLRMESAICDFYKAAQDAGIDIEYIIEDICDKVYDATNNEITLMEE